MIESDDWKDREMALDLLENCEALLNVALKSQNWKDRQKAIQKLAENDCFSELGVVANEGEYWQDRKMALDLLGSTRYSPYAAKQTGLSSCNLA